MTITTRTTVLSVALAAVVLLPSSVSAQQPQQQPQLQQQPSQQPQLPQQPPQQQQSQQQPQQQRSIGDRVAAAMQDVQQACAGDVSKFCGSVTPGEGRMLLCMQAHDDQLSRGCQFSLYRASRNLERAINRVERLADACWSDIQAQCANADGIGQCMMERAQAQSLSPACQTVVTGLRQVRQGMETSGSGAR